MPNQLNLKTQRGISGGFRGPKSKSWDAVKWLDRLAPHLVHVCGFVWELTYNSPLDIQIVGGGELGGSQIQESEEDVKRLVRLASNLVHMCRSILEWIYASQIALRGTRGHLGVLGGQTFKSQGKLSNGWTDWHQLWFTSADSSGNGHRPNMGMSGGGG